MPKFGKVRPKESEVMKRKPFHMKTASYTTTVPYVCNILVELRLEFP